MTFEIVTQMTESKRFDLTWDEWVAFIQTCPEPSEHCPQEEIQMRWDLAKGQLNMSGRTFSWIYDPIEDWGA